MATTPTGLAAEFTLGNGVVIKNRLFKSAMSEALGTKGHDPKPELAVLYKAWAEGGIGLCVTGNVMIDRTALGEPGNVVLDEDSGLDEFRRWAEAGSVNGTSLWMQINHPGKQIPNFVCKEPVAPSAIPLEAGLEKVFNTPRALTESEIQSLIEKFACTARMAKETGFQGVQIHCAHGYLLNQFLSPRHNQRDDQWGGSLENRIRFPLEVYRAVRAEVGGEYPVGVKLNSADFMKGGFTEEDSMQVVQQLAEAGIDLIEISGGTYENPAMMGADVKESTLQREAYFLDYAEKVRGLVKTPLAVTGGFRSAKGMNAALAGGATDFIGIARPLAIDPGFPNKLLNDPEASMTLRKLTTGIAMLDQMSMLDLTWYEQQMALTGRGKATQPNLSEWKVCAKTILSFGRYAMSPRRA